MNSNSFQFCLNQCMLRTRACIAYHSIDAIDFRDGIFFGMNDTVTVTATAAIFLHRSIVYYYPVQAVIYMNAFTQNRKLFFSSSFFYCFASDCSIQSGTG